MSRDMQVGLLLVVGFIALVGGVLYYRIEHPDELENYLQGSSTQAQATAPSATNPEKMASNGALPTAPAASVPALENVITFQDKPASTTPGNTPPGSPVTLTGGNASAEAAKPIPTSTSPSLPVPMSAPALPMVAMDDKKPATSEPKKSDTATRSSLPSEPPTSTANAAPPPSTAPSISLNVDGPPSLTGNVPDTKKVDEKKPADTVSKNDNKGLVPLAIGAGIVMSDPAKPKEGEKKSEELPQPPGLPQNAPSLGGVNLDVSKTTPPVNPAGNSTAPATGSGSMPPPGVAGAPSLSNPPSLANNAPANATPPITNAPALGGTSLPASPTGPMLGSSAPNSNTSSPPVTASPMLNANAPALNPTGPASTTLNTVPETVIKPNQGGSPLAASVERGTVDSDNMRVYPPKVGLGKPMTESEAQSRERRWAETAGSPSPIVPSAATSFGGSGVSAPATSASDRRVVRDTYIPTERALRGETFSSLSQRLYGDTNYAAALTAFNKEEGFVKMDQPEPNEWVAKPNREILDQRYPHLIRKLTPTAYNPNTLVNQAPNTSRPTAAAPAANFQTYRVSKGEQLFEVAKKTLGDGYRWSEIYALNKDQLRDSTELRPDMVLKIPANTGK
ncbi:MAG: LysM peptidoglycan-binding domain-containing protein [Gemmatales bacterium]